MPRKIKEPRALGSREWRIGVPLLAALIVFFGGVGLLNAQSTGSDFWNAVVDRVSEKLASGLSLGGGAAEIVSPASPIEDELPVTFGSTNVRNTGTTSFGNCTSQKDTTTGVALEECMFTGTIGTSSSTFHDLIVRQGGPWFITDYAVMLDGTTSSTTRFSAGTSTVSLAPDFSAAGAAIARGLIAEASSVTGTAFDVIDRGYSLNGGRGTVLTNLASSSSRQRVSNGDHIVGYMTTGGSNAIQGSSVTSTAGRGFTANSRWLLKMIRFATSTR